jgi:hypothetical protein
MAKKSRPTFQKQQKEHARHQKQQEKAARRLQAKQRRIDAKSGVSEAALDMAVIRPDPQPIPASRHQGSDPAEPLPRVGAG